MAEKQTSTTELPEPFEAFKKNFPEVFRAYEGMGRVAHAAGTLDVKTREFVQLGMAIGAGLEGATHSHVRKALAAGATAAEVRHAAVLAVTTLGFPSMMMGLTWVEDMLTRAEIAAG
jgi:alkylhydroperoxidase/carboxymuconolactone decarboxylase family protein YurZ